MKTRRQARKELYLKRYNKIYNDVVGMKSWEYIAKKYGFKNVNSARVRASQIMKILGEVDVKS